MNRIMAMMLILPMITLQSGCGKKPVAANTTKSDVASGDQKPSASGQANRDTPEQVTLTTHKQNKPPMNTNYIGGGGPVKNVSQAARRTVGLNEMKELGLTIQQMQIDLPDMRMPTKEEILKAVSEMKLLNEMITEGSIILTGTTERGGLWAYEYNSDVKGGIILVGPTAMRATAEEVRQHLGK